MNYFEGIRNKNIMEEKTSLANSTSIMEASKAVDSKNKT